MPLQLARQPRRFYETNPLRSAICQVRFPRVFDLDAVIARFHDHVKERYPSHAPMQQLGLTVSPQGASGVQSQFWRFSNPIDPAWSVALAPDFATLETTDYSQFEEFQERFGELLDGVAAMGVTQRSRLGLRFVNEIHHPQAASPADWRRFLNSELLGMVGGKVLGDDVIYALQEIRLLEDDGILVIRHGYLGSQATNDDSHYQIDLDHYNETSEPLDRVEALHQVEVYHARMKDVFELSITDELREHLVVKEIVDA